MNDTANTLTTRTYRLPAGFLLCRLRPGTGRAIRERYDRATIYTPSGSIYWSGRSTTEGARLVRLIRSGRA